MANDKKDNSDSSLLWGICKAAWTQIVVPKSKEIANNTVVDVLYMFTDYLSNVIGRRIYGPDKNISSRQNNTSRTPYSRQFRSNNNQQPLQQQQNVGMRSSTELQYVVADSREQAEEWKNDMINAISRFGHVPVATLYEKTGGKVKPLFNDFDYGWTRVEDIHYQRNADGYWFNLPTPKKIK